MKRKAPQPIQSGSLGITMPAATKPRPMPPPLPKPPTTPFPGSTISLTPTVPTISPAITNYRAFLNSLVGKGTANLNAAQVGNWQDIDPTTHQGLIVDEIAKKFNNHNRLGIGNVTYNPNRGDSYYSINNSSKLPQMDLSSQGKGDTGMMVGPEPMHVGHELIHANDHQIDQLNPKVWRNLLTLAQGRSPHELLDPNSFSKSIGNIQKKLDPLRNFFDKYKMGIGKIGQQIADARQNHYKTPYTGGAIDWPQLNQDIQGITATAAQPGGMPNPPYALPFASEFPAFMMEKLTNSWRTNQTVPTTRRAYGTPALSRPEARFVHSTLGDMSDAYPEANYPVMNHYIKQRRNSIEQAYEPGASTYPSTLTPQQQAIMPPLPTNFGLPPTAANGALSTATFSRGGIVREAIRRRNGLSDCFF